MRHLVLALLLPAMAVAAAPKKAAFRTTDVDSVLAGKTVTIHFYGQDLAPKEIRFDKGGITAKVLKTEPNPGKSDEERARGNTSVEVEVTVPAGLTPGYYPFKLVHEGGEVAGRLMVDIAAPEVQETGSHDSLSHPQVLPGGSVTVIGKLDGSGVDVYQFHGNAGESWHFQAFTTAGQTGPDPVIRIREPRHHAPVKLAIRHGNRCALDYTLPETGDYLIELFDSENRANGSFTYRLALRKM